MKESGKTNAAISNSAFSRSGSTVGPQAQPFQMISHPNFSGVWQVDFQKSYLEIEAPTSSVFTLQHQDPLLKLTRTHKAEDYEDTFSLVLSTDGTECISHKGDVEIRSTCVWQDATLCFQSRFLVQGAKAENTVIYSMSEDGQEILADETFTEPRRSYHNKWVLVRQATGQPD